MPEIECDHERAYKYHEYTKRFGGAITCDSCNLVIGFWKADQSKVYLNGSITKEEK